MRKIIAPVMLSALGFVAPMLAPSTAQAGIEACGDIHVEASAKCEAVVEGGCDVRCTALKFEAQCAAKLEVSCQGSCTAQPPSVECTGSCEAECSGQCATNPEFSCEASCSADAEADCSAACSRKAR